MSPGRQSSTGSASKQYATLVIRSVFLSRKSHGDSDRPRRDFGVKKTLWIIRFSREGKEAESTENQRSSFVKCKLFKMAHLLISRLANQTT